MREGRIRGADASCTTEVTGLREGRRERHLFYYSADFAEARKILPWASPAVYTTIGGTPITLALALLREQLTQRGVPSLAQLDNRQDYLDQLVERKINVVHKVIAET